MKNMLTAKITTNGQVTIPKKLRGKYLSNTHIVEFLEEGGSIVVRPVEIHAEESSYLTMLDEQMQEWAESEHDDLFVLPKK